MKKYTKIYMDYFGYTIDEVIECEICSSVAVDIHHILARSKRKDLENDITNLMALCRTCHDAKGDKKKYIKELNDIHRTKLNSIIGK